VISDIFADLTKIKDSLGFIPRYNFDAGVNNFVEWVNAQNIEEDNYKKSIKEMKEKKLFK